MKKIITIALLLCSTLGIQAQSLFVGTYNIRYLNNDDQKSGNVWQRRCQVICDQINFEQPDIFGTQEVLAVQLRDMLARLDNYDYVGVGRDDGKEAGEFSAIIYKKDKVKLLDKGNFWLSETPEKPGLGWDAACVRICSWGKFKDLKTKKSFFYFNLHLDHVGIVARREAAKLVVSKIKEIAKGQPVILTGDFNVDQRDEIYTIFTNSGILKDTFTSTRLRFVENCSWQGFNPFVTTDNRIDHIFVSPKFDVDSYGVLQNFYWTSEPDPNINYEGYYTPEGYQRSTLRLASDHYPVFARISYKK